MCASRTNKHKTASPAIETTLFARATAVLFFSAVAWLLYRGWQLRHEHYITAERGIGYALGITGGVLMLLLLLYPLRKNLRVMRNWGPIRYWFRLHMLFGVLGPSLILFHANFGLGSLNSNIALGCMLLVATSGIVGRFFYSRIHYGLYGRKASLQELSDIVTNNRDQLSWLDDCGEKVTGHFQSLEAISLKKPGGVIESLSRWFRYIATAWWHHWRLRRLLGISLKDKSKNQGWSRTIYRRHRHELHKYLRTYRRASRKVLEFSFYERLFSLWHVFHLPFFFMMLLSGIIHVIAVHMY